MKRIIPILVSWLLATSAHAEISQLLQLIDYVGVDYAEAVSQGQVINKNEYAEMQEFSGNINDQLAQLAITPASDQLNVLAGQLGNAIETKADPDIVGTITRQMRELLMTNYNAVLTPRNAPDLAAGETLYQENCAGCHGVDARGDGPAAAGLDPAPTDFTDVERARQRSLYGLYNTITLGVEGTAMTGYNRLTDAQRWALAFYVGSRYADESLLTAGKSASQDAQVSLYDAVVLSPNELETRHSRGEALSAWLRNHPESLFQDRTNPIAVAMNNLEQSLAEYRIGNVKQAEKLALDAYLEGFELAEAALGNISRQLVLDTERAMMDYRYGVTDRVSSEELAQRYQAATALLLEANDTLGSASLSPTVAFTSSLIILLREGLEAILILAAMIAILIKTDRREGLVYLHVGWITALVAGLATWGFSSFLLTITGATREFTEGATALIAAAILFYVGFWMHGNAHAREWGQYLKEKMHDAMSKRTLWIIGLISFLAVYREAFETVLFYQALWVQATDDAHSSIASGGILAATILVLMVWVMIRYGLRIPMKQFFSVSAILMIVLSVVFAGQGVAALQEAGRLSVYPLPLPSIELLGIFPNAQGLGLQLLIVVFATVLILYQRRRATV